MDTKNREFMGNKDIWQDFQNKEEAHLKLPASG